MSKEGYIRLIAALTISLGAGGLFAQTPSDSNESANTDSAVRSSAYSQEGTAPSSDGVNSQGQQFTGALNGSGLIPMDDGEKGLLFSTSFGGGWDSNPSITSQSVSSGMYTVSPFIGFHGFSPKKQYVLQYQPTLIGYMSGLYKRQILHVASASFIGTLNERWKLTLNGTGSYGPNAARFLAPQQTTAVGEVPGTGAGSASYLADSGMVTYIVGSAGLQYRKSERDTILLDGSNSYNRTSGFDQQGSAVTGKLSYLHDLSQTVGLGSYGQVSHYYGDLKCNSFGVGVGLNWRPGERTLLSLSGGPQFNTDACGDKFGYSYSGSFSTRLSRKSQLYLLSNYLPTVSYLGPGLRQRSASGGYQYQITPVGVLSFDAGYTSSDSLTAVSSYRGIFFDVNYGFRLRHGLAVAYSYRGYLSNSGGTNINRNLAQFSLSWTSNTGQVFQNH